MWLLYVSCAWVLGTFLGSELSLPLLALAIGIIPFAVIPCFPGSRKTLIVAGLCVLALLGGILHYGTSLPSAGEDSLCSYNDRGVVHIHGRVAEEPDVRDTYCLLTFAAADITVDGESREVSGNALMRVSRYPAYRYGDQLAVTGKLVTPPQLEGFDYAGYLAHRGIYSIIYYPLVDVVDHGQGFAPLRRISSLRASLSVSLARALPEPQASLAQGILLGQREGIPDSLHQSFSRTGTAHLLAISGLHVGIILAMFLSFAVIVFGRQRGIHIWIAMAGIWLYAMLAGMRPPVIRAATMGSLFLMAECLGRQRSAIIALAFAAAVMVGIDPHLLWSVSFQMSFSAMAGLVLLFPYFQAWGQKGVARVSGGNKALTGTGRAMTDVFAATLAATVAVGPLIAHNFGVLSLVALPATFLCLPTLPFIIVTAALCAFVGLFAVFAAQILGWVAWLFLSYLIFVVQGLDALPYSSLEVNASPWHVWIYYGILAAVLASLSYRGQLTGLFRKLASRLRNAADGIPRPHIPLSAKWPVLPLLIVAILVWSAVLTLPDHNLRVSFLDVGQGDAILIQTPAGQNILVDGGPDTQRIGLALSEKLPFWNRTIDLVVITQPQADHITGLVEVLQTYEVNQVLDPGVPYDSSIYRELLRRIEDKDIELSIARSGQRIDLGDGIILDVLNPPRQFFEGTSCDVDNNGLVLRLTWNEISFLLTADIRQEAELDLIMQRPNLRSTVLKAAHHGSMTSTMPQFLAAVDPEVAVISVGAHNPFGHPSPVVLERLIDWVGEDNVYRTDRQGTIELITDGEGLWVRTGK